MTRTRILIAFAAALLVAQLASAQMGGGGHHGSTPSTPSTPGTPTTPPSTSNPPSGGMHDVGGGYGWMNGGMMDGMGGAMGASLTVGADGVAYTFRTVAPTGTTTTPAVEVVAVRPSGVIAWATKVDGRMARIALSGSVVHVVSGDGDMAMDATGAFADRSRLTGLSAASGVVQWQLDLGGPAMSIEPFAGGVYVLVVRHDGTATTASMKRSIAAVSDAGKVLWTIDLN